MNAFDLGYERGTLPVYVFHDSREDLRWFQRDCEHVGDIETWLDGGKPADPAEVLRVAREAFGPNVSVLWP